jgi:hypothetical protein
MKLADRNAGSACPGQAGLKLPLRRFILAHAWGALRCLVRVPEGLWNEGPASGADAGIERAFACSGS